MNGETSLEKLSECKEVLQAAQPQKNRKEGIE